MGGKGGARGGSQKGQGTQEAKEHPEKDRSEDSKNETVDTKSIPLQMHHLLSAYRDANLKRGEELHEGRERRRWLISTQTLPHFPISFRKVKSKNG